MADRHVFGKDLESGNAQVGKFGTGSVQMGLEKFPIFAVNCSCLPLSSGRIREKRRKTKKCEEKRRKSEKANKNDKKQNLKKGKIPPTPSRPTPLRTSEPGSGGH